MMSLSEWEAELKCSATGKPGELFRMLRRCSPKRSRSRLPVSPMYKQPQRRTVVYCESVNLIGYITEHYLLIVYGNKVGTGDCMRDCTRDPFSTWRATFEPDVT